MDSIANEIQAYKDDLVRETAYDFRLPFALKELRRCAQEGEREAWVTYSTKSDQVERPRHVRRCIYKAVAAGTAEEEAKSETRPPPEDKRIREALETFKKPEEWKHLFEGCGYEEVRAFKGFLAANKDELEHSLRRDRYKGIYLRAWERGLVLRLRGKVEVFDIWAPLRALRLWQENRELNRRDYVTATPE